MPVNKVHDEFRAVDLESGWQAPAGYKPGSGVSEKILSGALDEVHKRGTRTRLLKFESGAFSTSTIVHDYWEEVYLLRGDLIVGNDAQGNGGRPFTGDTYAVRPPGAIHGPFKSETGCTLLEIHYYDPV